MDQKLFKKLNMGNSMQSYRCVVLGVGNRGREHVSWLKNRKNVELTAVCDYNIEQAQIVGQDAKTNVYTDYISCIEKEKPDAVFIASPHYLHAPMTIIAAENDAHVLCEKVMANTLSDCDRMIRACEKNDVKLAIGYQRRYFPEYEYMYDAVRGAEGENGRLGQITDVYMVGRHPRGMTYYENSSLVDPATGVSPGPWRGRWETEGSGELMTLASHNIDIFRHIAGPIRSLSGYCISLSPEHKYNENEDTISVALELENGAVGTMIFTSTSTIHEENQITVHGTKGWIKAVGGYAGERITMDTRYNDEEEYEVPWYTDEIDKDQVSNFFHAIENDISPKVSGKEGRRSVEIIRAILKSSQTGRASQFPFKDDGGYPYVHNIPYSQDC